MANLPLAGRTVLVTRPAERSGPLTRLLEEQGARVLLEPLLSFGPPPNPEAVRQALGQLQSYRWLVFVSPTGVDSFWSACQAAGVDPKELAQHSFAAIGPATAAALAARGLRAEFVPRTNFSSEGLAEELTRVVAGQSVLLIRADRGREVLADRLGRVAHVTQVAFYQQVESDRLREATRQEWAAGRLDVVVATSSAAVRLLSKLAADSGLQTRPRLVVISGVTAAAARAEGWPVAAVARFASDEGLAAAVTQAFGGAEHGKVQEGSSRTVSQAR